MFLRSIAGAVQAEANNDPANVSWLTSETCLFFDGFSTESDKVSTVC